MSQPVRSPRKLIEVALPLDAINVAAAREKSIRHGHPSTLHLWWARRPLAAARAVIFAQLVNDPGYQQDRGFKYGKNKKEAAIERKRLFKIIEDLVLWESTNNEEVLERARTEIQRSWREVCELNKNHPQASELFNPEKLPALYDPFAGGGAIPLEAQRLGLEVYASDLNPVAVLINKAMIEIPPKFAGRAPVGPIPPDESRPTLDLHRPWVGATGLAEDVRRYGAWMRAEAQKRIGQLYPAIEITDEIARERPDLKLVVGKKLTVIAWLWARTVKSPNPAFSHVDVPLASTFILSSKQGKDAYIEPVVRGDSYHFKIRMCTPPPESATGTKLARGANFKCLLSGIPIQPDYIKAEGVAGRMGNRLMAVVVEGPKGRSYLEPTEQMESVARSCEPSWRPETPLPNDPRNFWTLNYGLTSFGDLFTQRQLVALTTFADLLVEAKEKAYQDAVVAGWYDDRQGLDSGGNGAYAYSEAICVYLAFVIDKCSDYWSSICSWHSSGEKMRNTFGRQAIPMVWDFAECNPFCDSSGNWMAMVDWTSKALRTVPANSYGRAVQCDAQTQTIALNKVVSSDPPYYDNISYADLSDFFYVWLRKALKPIFLGLFATVAVPKSEELIATPYRHGNKEQAESFFLEGMTQAMHGLSEQSHPEMPISIYYAFKQSETEGKSGTTSTGWETFLEAVNHAGLQLTGTWPMRTELTNRMIGSGTNALASSIVLVCRKRSKFAETISRREFLRELNAVLPDALDEMTKGSGGDRSPVAPVDLSQAIIGPGMAVFSKYAAVLEADGSPMSVRTALQLINRFLAEDDFDRDTQFCLHWFEQNGWKDGPFGDAETLSRAKGTSVDGVRDAGVIKSGGGKVRLLKWSEYDEGWDPNHDNRNPIWETLHHLIRTLKQNGETGSGCLLSSVKNQAESVRQLAYRLYTLCERQGWSEDARAYNELITSWSAIESAAAAAPVEKQLSVFE